MDLTKDKLRDYLKVIRDNTTANDGSKDILATAIASLENDGNDTVTSLGVATGEAIDRKKSVRTLKTENQELEDKNLDLTQKLDADDPNADKLKDLEAYKTKNIASQRDTLGTRINEVSKLPAFERAKSFFKLPEAVEGVYDIKDISQDDLEHNLNELGRLDTLGIFDTSSNGKPKPNVEGSKGGKTTPTDFGSRIKAAKTHKEIQALEDERRGT